MPPAQGPERRAVRSGPRLGGLLRALGFAVIALLGLGTLAGVLLLRAPLTLYTRGAEMPPQVAGLNGTPGRGQAVLDGGYVIDWTLSPGLGPWPGLTGPVRLSGPDTLVEGEARVTWRGMGVVGLSGRAGPGLAALVPGAWDCAMTARIEDVTLLWRGRAAEGAGRVLLPPGACRKDGREIEMPEQILSLSTDGPDARAVLATGDGTGLATLDVTGERRARLEVTPEAGAVYPALPVSGPLQLEYAF